MELEELINSIDIVDYISQLVELTERNGEFWGLSPFRDEKTPSFSIRRETNSFYDFSSGIGGNVFTFVKYYNHCSAREAVEILKKYVGCDGQTVAPRKKLAATIVCKKFKPQKKNAKTSSATVFQENCMEKYEKRDDKLAIWEQEGVSRASLDKFQVYYDSFSNRLVYPIRNIEGKIVNIGGRTLDPQWKEKKLRKYTYFSGWGEMNVIYGLYENLEEIKRKREVIIFEGCKSVLMADTWGIHNGAALLTSHLNMQVKGSHEPIVTEEEFERVQQTIASRRKELSNVTAGKRKTKGVKQPGDVWTEILICECDHKFNRKIWHRLEDKVQYGYQCYSSIRTGTVTTRTRKGLSLEGVCRTPMIAGWKLQMMAKHIFREYLTNTAEIIALAESMLARHIDDEDKLEDNARLIEQKQKELSKLNKRLHNLIEMRADGEITKDVFKDKKDEIEQRIATIQKELNELQPQEPPEDDASHDEKITLLKYYLEQSVSPDDDRDIPDDVIKAFVTKVVVHESSFDWYLRFNPDKTPYSLGVDGRRKNTAKISSLCSPQHRLLLRIRSNLIYLLMGKTIYQP